MILFSIAFAQTQYLPLQDQTWKVCKSDAIENNVYNLSFQYCYNNIELESLNKEVEDISFKVFSFAKEKNLPRMECVKDLSLEIYETSMKVLNDRNRFSFYQNMTALPIWGMYDPRNFKSKTSTIVITDHGKKWNNLTLAHEVSHYWFDRYCWNNSWAKKPEDFAMEFEKYYMEKQ